MSFGRKLRRLFNRVSPARQGLGSMADGDIRNIIEESLEETEATSELVEKAQHAHERARDLMRQGHLEEALDRFREAIGAWESQAALCRELGFKNLWRGKRAEVGREMEELRINHLDVLDIESFSYLGRKARLRKNQLAQVLQMAGNAAGVSESEIYSAFPAYQREDIRAILFQVQRRGWITRENVAGRYLLHTSKSAPQITPGV